MKMLVALAGILCAACLAQSPPATLPIDPFIGGVETIKHSVAPLVCVAVNETEFTILERTGSAFFISASGDFLTAAHVVLEMLNGERPCPVSAVTIPIDTWRPEALHETMVWFDFKISLCNVDADLDVARCRLNDDMSVPKRGLSFKIAPAHIGWNIPPDGTQVAFTGFPLRVPDPMTSRATVATYRTVLEREKPSSELVLDRAAWPGSSGSPVYLADGTVIAILIAGGKDEGAGLTIARPALLIRELLAKEPKPSSPK